MIAKDLTYLEIKKSTDKIAVLPIGSMEQHGPYIPVGSDAIAAETVAHAMEKKLPNEIVVFPTIYYGCSKEHAGFAGTTYFEYDTYYKLINEILTSIFTAGFKKLMIIGGHGGNHLILQVIQSNWNYDHGDQKVFYHFVYSENVCQFASKQFGEMEAHAGSVETSVIYAISDQHIKTKQKTIKNTDFKRKHVDTFSVYSSKQMSKYGVITESDTLNISVQKGKKVLDFMVEDTLTEFKRIKNINLKL